MMHVVYKVKIWRMCLIDLPCLCRAFGHLFYIVLQVAEISFLRLLFSLLAILLVFI
jgi:hypothetical protein